MTVRPAPSFVAVFNFDHHTTNHFLDIENVVLEFVFYLCF